MAKKDKSNDIYPGLTEVHEIDTSKLDPYGNFPKPKPTSPIAAAAAHLAKSQDPMEWVTLALVIGIPLALLYTSLW